MAAFPGRAAALAAAASALLTAAAGPGASPLPAPRPEDPRPAALAAAAAPRPLDVRTRPVSFQLGAAPRLTAGGALAATADHPLWGGLSGLVVEPDGVGFLAVSDRGALFAGRFRREAGALAGIDSLVEVPLRDPEGRPLAPGLMDPEGLALGPDGALHVSFEGPAPAIWRYAAPGAPASPLRPPPISAQSGNSGLEALAAAADGALIAIPERSGAVARPFPVFRLAPGAAAWAAGALPRADDFLVTGADIGPDGRLYVVERAFSWLGGFSVRLRVAALGDDPTLAPETLMVRRGGTDNVESVAAWRGPDGRLRLVLVTDDNFNALQRTLFAELILD